MTAQMPDLVDLDGDVFNIAGIKGDKLFDPAEHNLKPVACCSACWRGFLCEYVVKGCQLYLEHVRINLEKGQQLRIDYNRSPPALFDKSARSTKDELPRSFFNAMFSDLNHRIVFTGGLLLAKDFIRDLYVHMGFHPAWKFRIVYQLIFRDGELEKSIDRSAEVATLRDEMASIPLKPEGDATRVEIKDWIARCFSQEYRW